MLLLLRRVIQGFLCMAACAARAQDCHPYWADPGPNNASLYHVVIMDDGSGAALYAGGAFPIGFGYAHPGVARWDGHAWSLLSAGWPGVNQSYSGIDMRTLDFGTGPRLCAGTPADAPGGPQWTLVVWDGSQWQPGPAGMGGVNSWPYVCFDAGNGPKIYGITQIAPNASYSFSHWGVGRWSGSSWEVIGEYPTGISLVRALDLGDGPHLYVAGRNFNEIDHQTGFHGIAKWSGTAWQPLGTGICEWHVERDMTVHDDGTGPKLYLSDVVCAGGQPVHRIARWDGQSWSDVGGGGIDSNGITEVYCLASFDDGRGPALYAGGYLNSAGGGTPVRGLARFNGTSWDDVMGGLGGGIPWDFATFNDGRGQSLFIAGEFNRSGAGAAGTTIGIAQWVGCQGQCYANCDNSGTAPRLNIADFTCFLRKFAVRDPYADCNQDRAIDVGDFSCFLQRFGTGCAGR
jgi:hypothetical protein